MQNEDVYAELSSIKELMERSSKFISLSGFSGALAGVYAIAGAALAYMLMSRHENANAGEYYMDKPMLFWQLLNIGIAVLVFSLLTGFLLTMRKAKKRQENIWNPVSRRLLAAMAIPLATGGLFIIIMLAKGEYAAIASSCLIFYGLALFAGSHYTYVDIMWLGICEILLGLLALLMPQHSLLLWTVGFGLLHILYGSIMHFKYDR